MSNEIQPNSKLIFKAGEVFLESQGQRRPIEEIVDTSSPVGSKFVNASKSAAADYAELNGR